jgi:hypothetical protein
LVVEVGSAEVNNPFLLIQGDQKLTKIHRAQRKERIAKRQAESTTIAQSTSMDWSTSLYVQYATAIYGAQVALLACCGWNQHDDGWRGPHHHSYHDT